MPSDPATSLPSLGQLALALLARPGEPSGETLAACQRLFDAAGEEALSRWMDRERTGYGGSGAVPLPALLQVPDDAPLVSRVRSYRQHIGRVRTAVSAARPLQVPHFFGEPLHALQLLSANADAIGLDFIEVELLPAGQASDPQQMHKGPPARTLEFPRYTFYRILSGLAVELEGAVRAVMGGGPAFTPA